MLIVLIILAVIILVLVLIYIFSLIEEKEISLGENVLEIVFNENKTEANLKVNSGENIEKIKIIFIDDKNEKHQFETSFIAEEFTIPAKDAGLESFENIINVKAVFEYRQNSLPPEDENNGEEEIPIPDDCIPNCAGKECGDDGCKGSCGSCATGKKCEEGKCVDDICVAAANSVTCANNACGIRKNNCGQNINCGTCSSGNCVNGNCEITNTPNCPRAKCYFVSTNGNDNNAGMKSSTLIYVILSILVIGIVLVVIGIVMARRKKE